LLHALNAVGAICPWPVHCAADIATLMPAFPRTAEVDTSCVDYWGACFKCGAKENVGPLK
jgi:hypothetical protein